MFYKLPERLALDGRWIETITLGIHRYLFEQTWDRTHKIQAKVKMIFVLN